MNIADKHKLLCSWANRRRCEGRRVSRVRTVRKLQLRRTHVACTWRKL